MRTTWPVNTVVPGGILAVLLLCAVAVPAIAKATPIDVAYLRLGGASGFLGKPVDAERSTPDGVGWYRTYEHGSIHWSPATGAHETHGLIEQKWAQLGWEQGFLGFPTTDETTAPDGAGRYNHFRGGSIYWTPQTGAHEVHGYIRERWAALGWERSALGYPTSDEQARANRPGRVSYFQHGRIEWSQQEGAREILLARVAVPPSGGGQLVHPPPGDAAHLVLPATIAGALIGHIQQVAGPNAATVIVKESGQAHVVNPGTAAGALGIQPGDLLVREVTAETVSLPGARARYLFPARAVTANAAGETFDLQPALELATPGLEVTPDGTHFAGQILLGVQDRDRPDEQRALPRDVWVVLTSDAATVAPTQVRISHTNLPFESAVVSGHPSQDRVTVDMQAPSFRASLRREIPVLRPGVELSGPARVEGLGAGRVKITVSVASWAGTAPRNVTVTAGKGSVVPQMVTVSPAKSAEVEYRSRLLGFDAVEAATPELASARHPMEVGFPWVFLLSSFLGGGFGAVILRLLRPNRVLGVLTRYFLGGVLAGFLVACVYSLGVNVTSVPIPIEDTPVSIFAISAIGAIAAIPLVGNWSGDFRGFLEGGDGKP
jgi:hypothetical protein